MDFFMKMYLRYLYLLICLIPGINLAADVPANFPEALLYKDKPIDPLCIYAAQSSVDTVALASCGIATEKGRKIIGQNDNLIKKGYVGFNYKWDDSPLQGYSYYKAVGESDKSPIVYAINNTGGSGQFSYILLLTRIKDDIKVKSIIGGDRCNGGIYGVKHQNNKLTYSVNLTAYDFLELANDNPYHLNAYNDLNACAACCAAGAVFERDLNQHFNQEKLVYVDLNAYPTDNEVVSNQPYQLCFNQLIKAYKSKNKQHLDPAGLAKFTTEFNQTCVKPIKKAN